MTEERGRACLEDADAGPADEADDDGGGPPGVRAVVDVAGAGVRSLQVAAVEHVRDEEERDEQCERDEEAEPGRGGG